MPDLVLPLKTVYFDAIRLGQKAEEFRLRTPYWRRRLEGRTFDRVVLTKGYPPSSRRQPPPGARVARVQRNHHHAPPLRP